MIYTYDYDASYLPAAPVIEIRIGRALSTPSLALTALIDTGADGLVIPLTRLRQIRARKERKAWLRTVTGFRAPVDIYSISLQFGPFAFQDVAVAGGSQPTEVIIGRDILNQFIVTLNGLASAVEITQ
jgi:hypothetical protein